MFMYARQIRRYSPEAPRKAKSGREPAIPAMDRTTETAIPKEIPWTAVAFA